MENDLFEITEKSSQKVFLRYNREERLKNASEKVRNLYDPAFIQKKGLIKSLTANRGLSSVFFIVILLIVLNLVFFFTNGNKNTGIVSGVKTELQTFLYQDKVLANIKLNENKKYSFEKNGYSVRVQFVFFDDDKNKISSFLTEGFYSGTELRFSAADETGTAKTIQANILLKENLLILKQRLKNK